MNFSAFVISWHFFDFYFSERTQNLINQGEPLMVFELKIEKIITRTTERKIELRKILLPERQYLHNRQANDLRRERNNEPLPERQDKINKDELYTILISHSI